MGEITARPLLWSRLFLVSPRLGAIGFIHTHRTWVEERTWYEDGEELSAGGYYRTTKTLKDVDVEAHVLNIATDFKPIFRSKFETNAYQLPASKLWIDNQEE